MSDKIRVILGKIGLDAHDRGILLLQSAFKEAGMEVIYPGKFSTAERVVKTAMKEEANVIALSDHTGAMLTIATDVVEELKKKGMANSICVVAGGIVSEEDKPLLEKMGVTGFYGQGTPVSVIVDHIMRKVAEMEENSSGK